MLVVGLTGSIGMGKSTVAGAVAGAAAFPFAMRMRRCTSSTREPPFPRSRRHFPARPQTARSTARSSPHALLAEPGRFKRLEAIVHPLVFEAEREFLRREASSGARYGGAGDPACCSRPAASAGSTPSSS